MSSVTATTNRMKRYRRFTTPADRIEDALELEAREEEPTKVQTRKRDYSRPMHTGPWTRGEIAQLRALFEKGFDVEAISLRMRRPIHGVYQQLNKQGLSLWLRDREAAA